MAVEKIGMRIKALREKRGLSQEELAGRAGLSRGYLARLETGRHEPTLTTLGKLAKALRVKIGALVE
jgi:transcriptional regulator with XRE-family HTH domain